MAGPGLEPGRLWRGDGLSRLRLEPAGRSSRAEQGRLDTELILIALLFAFGHPYHYLTGVVDNFPWGVVYRPLYLVLGGNLWLPFVAHGVENTAALVLLFFGSIF